MRTGKPYNDKRSGERAKINGNEHKLGYKNNFDIQNKGVRYPLSVIKIQKYNIKGQHPTQKPVALFEYLIKTYTNEGETVLDNCMGSGTTGVACLNTGRNFIGIELDDKYFEIAKERIESHEVQIGWIK
jgi:site-specific DNA-methyltransferase (adenine-specific)